MLAPPGAAARAKGKAIVRGPAVAPAARELMRRRRLVNMGVHLSEAVPPLSGI
jgi:hypothetical protein